MPNTLAVQDDRHKSRGNRSGCAHDHSSIYLYFSADKTLYETLSLNNYSNSPSLYYPLVLLQYNKKLNNNSCCAVEEKFLKLKTQYSILSK